MRMRQKMNFRIFLYLRKRDAVWASQQRWLMTAASVYQQIHNKYMNVGERGID